MMFWWCQRNALLKFDPKQDSKKSKINDEVGMILEVGKSLGVNIIGEEEDMVQNTIGLEKRDATNRGKLSGSMRRGNHEKCQWRC